MSAALVAGLARTIGQGFEEAVRLAEQGYHVIVSAPQRSAAEIVAARLRARGFAASPVCLDLRDVAAFPVIIAELCGRFGAIEVLIDGSDGQSQELVTALRPLLGAEPAAV